jgi:hypothetical protein
MIPGKSEVAELKPEAFQLVERLSAGVNMILFSETFISFLGDEHHSHPVIAGITRNLFRATAIYNFHIVYFSCRTFIGQTLSGLPRATKKRLVG